jgi:hypothetical protein
VPLTKRARRGQQSRSGETGDSGGYATFTPCGVIRAVFGHHSDTRTLLKIWRRGWDLNPRWSFPHSGFRVRIIDTAQAVSSGISEYFHSRQPSKRQPYRHVPAEKVTTWAPYNQPPTQLPSLRRSGVSCLLLFDLLLSPRPTRPSDPFAPTEKWNLIPPGSSIIRSLGARRGALAAASSAINDLTPKTPGRSHPAINHKAAANAEARIKKIVFFTSYTSISVNHHEHARDVNHTRRCMR